MGRRSNRGLSSQATGCRWGDGKYCSIMDTKAFTERSTEGECLRGQSENFGCQSQRCCNPQYSSQKIQRRTKNCRCGCASKKSSTKKWEIPTKPMVAAKLQISFSPSELGKDERSAKVNYSTKGYTSMPSLRQRLALQTTIGEVSDLQRSDNGDWEATYQAPDSLTKPTAVCFLQSICLTLKMWLEWQHCPCEEMLRLHYSTPANAEVSLEFREQSYGPYYVKNDGKAIFNVDLHPQQHRAN